MTAWAVAFLLGTVAAIVVAAVLFMRGRRYEAAKRDAQAGEEYKATRREIDDAVRRARDDDPREWLRDYLDK